MRPIIVTLAAQPKSHYLASEVLEEKTFHFYEELSDFTFNKIISGHKNNGTIVSSTSLEYTSEALLVGYALIYVLLLLVRAFVSTFLLFPNDG